MYKILSSLVVGSVFLFGQTSQTVKEIKFEGLIHISNETAKEMIDIKEGDILDIEKVDSSIKKLYAQKYFTDITVNEDSGILTFVFKEKPIIAKIDITGFAEGKTQEKIKELDLKKGEAYDEEKIVAIKQKIIKELEKEGYFDTVVESTTKEVNPGSIQVDFLVNKGEEIIIKKIDFSGANKLGYTDFEPYIANKESEFMGWMWGRNDGVLKLEDLEYDSHRIKDVYMKEGYLDAAVSMPFFRAYFDGYFANLSYKIEEGEQYRVKNISVYMTQNVIEIEPIIAEFKLKEGWIFNIDRLRKDIKNIEDKIADLGYAYVKVMPDLNQNKEDKTVNVTISVDPGQKVHINDVKISGNSRTIDRVIRREIFLASGDLYSRTDLRDSKNALMRTGYFEDVTVEEHRVSAEKIDLNVKVKEAPTGSIIGGIGYGSYDGLLLNFAVSDKNVFGSGVELGVNIDYSEKSLKGKIYFQNPRVYDSKYSFGGSIYSSEYDYYDYDEEKQGFGLNVGKKYTRHFGASLGYVLEETELSEISETLDPKYYLEGATLKSAFVPGIFYDNTDDYHFPRSGFSASTSLELAGAGGDEKFTKISNKFAYYFGFDDIIDYDLILRYKAQLKFAQDNGYLPINERLYAGGISSLRGFKSNSFAPKDEDGDLVGGEIMFANSFEISIPIVEEAKMRMMFFYDYATIGDEGLDMDRMSTGTGIEWVSPLGPIMLIYAFPLNEEEGDRTSDFEFTMGRRF